MSGRRVRSIKASATRWALAHGIPPEAATPTTTLMRRLKKNYQRMKRPQFVNSVIVRFQ